MSTTTAAPQGTAIATAHTDHDRSSAQRAPPPSAGSRPLARSETLIAPPAVSLSHNANACLVAVAAPDQRPELLERGLVARLVLQPLVPHLGVEAVVGLLAVDLGREPRDLLVAALLQPREPLGVGAFVEDVSRDRALPFREPQLDQL